MTAGGKRSGSAADKQPPAKKVKRSDTKMTAEEIRQLIPNELKQFIQDSQDRSEYQQRLHTLFAYLFHRLVYYPAGTLATVVSVIRPTSITPIAVEQFEAQTLLDELIGAISKTHRRLTTHFLESTKYGREYWGKLSISRRSKIKLPLLDLDKIIECLDLGAPALRAIWFPLTVTVPSELWEASKYPAGEEWAPMGDVNTATLARFRQLSAEIVRKMVHLSSKSQVELSTQSQVAVFKAMSGQMLASEWPPFDASAKHLSSFWTRGYMPQKIYEFLDMGFKTRAVQFKEREARAQAEAAAGEAAAAHDADKIDGSGESSQEKGDIDMDIDSIIEAVFPTVRPGLWTIVDGLHSPVQSVVAVD